MTTLAQLEAATAHIRDRDIRIVVGRRLPDGGIETFALTEVVGAECDYDPERGPGVLLVGSDLEGP